jgi:hypothetical protein
MWVKNCDSCGCPAPGPRLSCAWCDEPLTTAAPVTFVVERSDERFEWLADGTVVAAAVRLHGLWQIADARGRHVVTLMPLNQPRHNDRAALALVGPSARLLGTVYYDESISGQPGAATTCDGDGESVLVMRGDGATGSHMVDRNGEIVAVSSWGDRPGATDLLVTATGTHQSLALVFGLVLAAELSRPAQDHAPRRLA